MAVLFGLGLSFDVFARTARLLGSPEKILLKLALMASLPRSVLDFAAAGRQKYPDQISEDIAACEKIGAEEVILEVGFTLSAQDH